MDREELSNLISDCRSLNEKQKSYLLGFIKTSNSETIRQLLILFKNERLFRKTLIDFVNEKKIEAVKQCIRNFEEKKRSEEIEEAENLIKNL